MTAKQCVSLQEVRNEIDRIGSEMIRLSAERGGYVRQAAAFKKTMDDVQYKRENGQNILTIRKKLSL